ncbi:MAG: class I SAM-dependent methyltransferase [Ilumatobacteraceae bacterium]|jgi:ubiquinone/menaquinone biosynthesis C-methylase UbiE
MSAEPIGPIGNHYDKYGSSNRIERWMMDGFLGTLDGMLDGLQPSRVLEVGVGEGEILQRVAARFPQASTQGIDLPDDDLAEEWRRRGLTAEFGDATALRFADGEFDLVLAIEVLEHIPQPERALRELARVCRGTVVLSVPFEPVWRAGNMARGRYLKDWGNTPGHVNHWTRWSFAKAVGAHFEVDRVASPVPWTMVRGRVRAR